MHFITKVATIISMIHYEKQVKKVYKQISEGKNFTQHNLFPANEKQLKYQKQCVGQKLCYYVMLEIRKK